MDSSFSPDTQAALLLTAPLLTGQGQSSADILNPREYNQVARVLLDANRQPGDLLGPDAPELIAQCRHITDTSRLDLLLNRGFLLTQAIERWQARAIWVIGRTDTPYPSRITARLKDHAPAVLYGCGETSLLETGGLAIVGSRNVDPALVEYTENVGRLAASAQCTVVSGAARGIDQAAMRGALEAGGLVTGVLADSLERAALAREHREVLMDGRLTAISPYDPLAGFNVGNAMQRNKLIYALADAALVVSSDFEKGGTWAGAVEQLEKFRFGPVYVRSESDGEKGLDALRKKGARPWPNPSTPEYLAGVFAAPPPQCSPQQEELF